jgi:hypothetical protein
MHVHAWVSHTWFSILHVRICIRCNYMIKESCPIYHEHNANIFVMAMFIFPYQRESGSSLLTWAKWAHIRISMSGADLQYVCNLSFLLAFHFPVLDMYTLVNQMMHRTRKTCIDLSKTTYLVATYQVAFIESMRMGKVRNFPTMDQFASIQSSWTCSVSRHLTQHFCTSTSYMMMQIVCVHQLRCSCSLASVNELVVLLWHRLANMFARMSIMYASFSECMI